ncbi:MAG: MBL fold metallo-hydrolase [Candidatus Rokuibacteriota bacterium]|nr:MAG: MBL fold metallo-hydrolase [Candidatus Rokubacteria bacterium]
MVNLYALCGGYLDLDRHPMIPDGSAPRRWTVPIPCFLVVHPRGRVLFDTGVHEDAIGDPVGRLGAERAARFGIRSQTGDDVVSQLARLALRPADVTHVVNSHFHFDHCGGNEFFPRAAFLVQRREMEAARTPAILATGRYRPSPQDFDHPLPYCLVDGEHDVFGDGSVVAIPTPGHTPGHQSLLIRAAKGPPIVLAGDACYTKENMDRDLLPLVVWDPDEMSRSLASLRALRDTHGATLLYGHDPGQWQAMPRAPAAVV